MTVMMMTVMAVMVMCWLSHGAAKSASHDRDN
jgi:hypothetical protein